MQRIVVAANAEADQPWVADAAAQLAKETGAEVAVVSVDELETEKLSTLPRESFRERAEQAAANAAERLEAAGVSSTTTVLSGRALERILEFADEQDADLIVVGSAPRWRRQSRFFSPTVDYVLRKAPCEVMVIAYPEGVLAGDGAVL